MWAIYKKEVGSFYRSMIGCFYMAFFLFISGIFFTAFNLQGGVAEFGYVLGNTTTVLLVAVPVITMRTLGEERRQRTDQLLLTAPIKLSRIVLGKFFAVVTVFAAPLAVLCLCPAVLSLYGTIPLRQSYSCFLAFLFMGGACISVGIFVSSLTENPIICAVASFALLLLSYLIKGSGGLVGAAAVHSLAGFAVVILLAGVVLGIATRNRILAVVSVAVCGTALGGGYLADQSIFEGAFPKFLGGFSFFQRYYDFVDGIFDVTHLVYYAGVMVLFLFFTVQSLERRRGKNSFYSRAYSVSMCLLVVVMILLVNLIAGRLPSRYTQFDVSSSGLYSVSRQTRDMAEGLDQDVNIYLIAAAGEEDEKLVRLLDQYQELSPHIEIGYVDPVLNPSFVQGYTSSRVSDNSIIVAGEERSRVIRNSDLYPSEYDYDTGAITEKFDGEGQITSAIHYVTADSLAKIYLTTGHGENDLTDAFQASLEKEGVEIDLLNLTAVSRVPEDADCLFFYVPVSDITAREKEILSDWLERGGRMLLITGISASGMPEMEEVLSGYGLSAKQGMIVEGDANGCIPSYPHFLLPQIRSSEMTDPIISENGLILLPTAHAIALLEEKRGTVDVDAILVTSSQSWLKTDTASLSYQKGDATGPFAVGAMATEQTDQGETRIVWFSSSSILTEEVDEMVGGNNSDLALNAIGWMTEQDNGITIRPKETAAAGLRLTSAQAASWGVLFTVVIPLVIAVAGIVVCIRRGRR